ncbi:MAG: gamma carbonic anhydrase family protein [Bacillaceae bacterium]|nr:gamma carbonic anhydrase family protein [Bacillaceae bacterium]
MIYPYQNKHPKIDKTAFIAPGARIIGDVTIGEGSSIWFNTVLRGDEAPIQIGKRVNIQDNSMGHMYEGSPLILEDDVSIGHQVILHGCTIRKGALVGMGAVILDNVEIGEEAFIAAGSLVPPGKKIPPRTMVMGSPGKVVRELTEEDLELVRSTTRVYAEKAQQYRKEFENLK